MPNGVHKPNEFDAATQVMESGLLRALTDKSSSADGAHETEESQPAPRIEIVVAESVRGEVAPQNAPEPSHVADHTRARGLRVFVVAGMIAAVVLSFDASLFVFHPRRGMRAASPPAAPDPMPRYMILPLGTPAPAPAPTTIAALAEVLPAATASPVHGHRHSHHRHASH